MRVSDRAATTALSSAAAGRTASSGARFSLGGVEDPARAAAVRAAAPADAMSGLLAVQAAGDSIERRRRAMRRGRNILDTLDGLKVALLSGRVSAGRIETLRAQLGQRARYAEDPDLSDILAQIELRAEVELAKLAKG